MMHKIRSCNLPAVYIE